MVPSAQGTVVWWGSRRFGRVLNAKSTQGSPTEYDCTSKLSPVVGTGANTRIVRQVNPTDIAPAQITLELLGGSQFRRDDLGRVDTLRIRTAGGSLSGPAYLADFSTDIAAGEKLKSTATFKFTGF